MKSILAFIILALSFNAFAENLPTCSEGSSRPCVVAEAEEESYLINMMLANKAGMREVLSTGVNGLELDYISENPVTITILKEQTTTEDEFEIYISKIKFEIQLNDSQGTDAGEGSYLWTVIEDTTADGYTSQSKFKNTLKKL